MIYTAFVGTLEDETVPGGALRRAANSAAPLCYAAHSARGGG